MTDQNRNRSRGSYGKTSLIDDITSRTQGYNRRQVSEIVQAMLDTITEKVIAGQNVTLTGFGTFRRSERAARTVAAGDRRTREGELGIHVGSSGKGALGEEPAACGWLKKGIASVYPCGRGCLD